MALLGYGLDLVLGALAPLDVQIRQGTVCVVYTFIGLGGRESLHDIIQYNMLNLCGTLWESH
jgi:hypothetical protein